MKVLILTISAGYGHHATAQSLCTYLKEQSISCQILDAYKYINPLLSESVERGYLLSTQYTPRMYGSFYRLAEKKEKFNDYYGVMKFANSILGGKLLKFIKDANPDVVVCTHIFAAQLMTAFRDELCDVISIGIVTDYTIHPFWEDALLDYYVIASHLLQNQCLKKGIEPDRVLPFGIPIDKRFTFKISKKEARLKLGIENKKTILVMMGSMGYGNVPSLITKMDSLSMDFQVLAVCGKNARAQKRVKALPTRHKVYTYGFVDNVDVLMDAADFIVTKPGGLTVSESLAKGLPLILINPIPGQEDRNMEFLLNNGLAISVTKTFPIDEAIYQLYSNQWRTLNLSEGVSYIGKKDATKSLGDFIATLKKDE